MNFKSGKITYMSEYPGEDMLQVEYPDDFILDVGIYGEEPSPFIVKIIHDYDWEEPFAEYIAGDVKELKAILPQAIEKIEFELK